MLRLKQLRQNTCLYRPLNFTRRITDIHSTYKRCDTDKEFATCTIKKIYGRD